MFVVEYSEMPDSAGEPNGVGLGIGVGDPDQHAKSGTDAPNLDILAPYRGLRHTLDQGSHSSTVLLVVEGCRSRDRGCRKGRIQMREQLPTGGCLPLQGL